MQVNTRALAELFKIKEERKYETEMTFSRMLNTTGVSSLND